MGGVIGDWGRLENNDTEREKREKGEKRHNIKTKRRVKNGGIWP